MKKNKKSIPMRSLASLIIQSTDSEPEPTVVETTVHEGITIRSFTVTYDPLEDEYSTRVPQEDRKRISTLAFSKTSPSKKIPLLEAWIKQYPDFPRLYNFLSATYVAAKEHSAAEALIQETYERFPEYLFARINYVDFLLRKDRDAEVAAVFPEGWALPMIFPHRNTFHATEVTGLAGIAARYFLRQDNANQAAIHIRTLLKVGSKDNPSLPAILSELLEYRLRNGTSGNDLSELTTQLPLNRLFSGL